VSAQVNACQIFRHTEDRLTLAGIKFGIAVILLFNLEIRTVYINDKAMISVRRGVSNLNFWDRSVTIEEGNIRKISTLLLMASMDGPVISDKPSITIADDECPSQFATETCSSFSFLQGWARHGQSELHANPTNPDYVTLRQAPDYKLYLGQFYKPRRVVEFQCFTSMQIIYDTRSTPRVLWELDSMRPNRSGT